MSTSTDTGDDRDQEISLQRANLIGNLAAVQAGLRSADANLATLLDPRLYDDELAETTAGEDIAAHLADAARAVRAALAVAEKADVS